MSPIEVELYDAMRQRGLSPTPQFRIEAYYVDFAFPDIKLAIEADGAAHHSDERKERDRKRDWFLRRQGWTVKRFYGTTIHKKAANCAFIIKREVDDRRNRAVAHARQKEIERQERREAFARPFRKVAKFMMRNRQREGASRTDTVGSSPSKPPAHRTEQLLREDHKQQ